MKRLFSLTFFTLLAINCSGVNNYPTTGRGATMTYDVETHAQLDHGNQHRGK